jgi:hypothetical protein
MLVLVSPRLESHVISLKDDLHGNPAYGVAMRQLVIDEASDLSRRTICMPQLFLFIRLPVPKRDIAVFAAANDYTTRKG